jgi:hypothetical protein
LSEAPDLFEPVLGWRCWVIAGSTLRSVAIPHSWEAEETAVCKRTAPLYVSAGPPPASHAAPAGDCHCGLYAYHDPWMAERSRQNMEKQYGLQVVVGAVEMWGDVLVHGTGVRAEHARVLGLAVPPGSALRPWPASYRPGLLTGLTPVEAAAERYGVPAMPLGQLIEHVSEGRGRVPARLLPAVQPPLPTPPKLTLGDFLLPAYAVVMCVVVIATSSVLAVKLIWLVAVAFAVAALVNRLLAR